MDAARFTSDLTSHKYQNTVQNEVREVRQDLRLASQKRHAIIEETLVEARKPSLAGRAVSSIHAKRPVKGAAVSSAEIGRHGIAVVRLGGIG